ncbi:hypothetical protein NDU88_001027 [Pleurodeles waltl]|uniref:Uncharacterized protein n=1 Tax=Pleurodeles waltl TaxID=8319 RepID=A0AAV7WME0_PLEWA|nr:hypothetical protein NDU88_001027 [Pleurodeles waltl]
MGEAGLQEAGWNTTLLQTRKQSALWPPRAPDPAQTWEKQACKRQPGTPHYYKQENKAHCGPWASSSPRPCTNMGEAGLQEAAWNTTLLQTRKQSALWPPRAPDPAQTWEKQACKRQPGTPHYYKQENKAHCGLLELPTLHKHGRSRPARGSLEHHITTNKKTKRTVAPGPPRAPDPAQTWEKQACKRQPGTPHYYKQENKAHCGPGTSSSPRPCTNMGEAGLQEAAWNTTLLQTRKQSALWPRGLLELPTLHKHGRSRPARGSLEHHITTNKKTKRTVAPGPPRAPDPAQTWEKQACKRQPGTPHYHKQENKAHCGPGTSSSPRPCTNMGEAGLQEAGWK